jgi:hypothetical protein
MEAVFCFETLVVFIEVHDATGTAQSVYLLRYGLDDPGFESRQGKYFSVFRKSGLAVVPT